MSKVLRDRARDDFCRLLHQVGPDAPTLCEGWDSQHLAAHVWGMTHDPLAWPGIALPAFAGFTERRLRRAIAARPFPQLVAEIGRLDGFACMPTDRFEGYRHALGEFLVHTEDVRRANDLPPPELPVELADALWRRVQTVARQLHRRRHGGLALVRTDGDPTPVVIATGPGKVVTGPALELLLWAHRRGGHAAVDVARVPQI